MSVQSLNPMNQGLLDGFLVDCRLRRLTEESTRSHKSNVRIVGRFLESMNLGYLDIDKNALKLILDYLMTERKVSFKTADCYFTALSSFYEYLEYEERISHNPIPSFRKRYLKQYKTDVPESKRKLITVEEMSILINSTLEIRDKTIMTVLAKTGVRRNELISMDLGDIDWETQSIKLKPKKKRSNLTVFFDQETEILLRKWLHTRQFYPNQNTGALFLGEKGKRISRNMIYYMVTKHATRAGIHNPDSTRLEDHFTPHCFRHWFTTYLRKAEMNKDFIKELRGDSRGEAMDIYDHIDKKELRKAYLTAIPRLGIQ